MGDMSVYSNISNEVETYNIQKEIKEALLLSLPLKFVQQK